MFLLTTFTVKAKLSKKNLNNLGKNHALSRRYHLFANSISNVLLSQISVFYLMPFMLGDLCLFFVVVRVKQQAKPNLAVQG